VTSGTHSVPVQRHGQSNGTSDNTRPACGLEAVCSSCIANTVRRAFLVVSRRKPGGKTPVQPPIAPLTTTLAPTGSSASLLIKLSTIIASVIASEGESVESDVVCSSTLPMVREPNVPGLEGAGGSAGGGAGGSEGDETGEAGGSEGGEAGGSEGDERSEDHTSELD